MNTGWAILIGATLIAGAIMFSHRYQITSGAPGQVWRSELFSGKMVRCEDSVVSGELAVVCFGVPGPETLPY